MECYWSSAVVLCLVLQVGMVTCQFCTVDEGANIHESPAIDICSSQSVDGVNQPVYLDFTGAPNHQETVECVCEVTLSTSGSMRYTYRSGWEDSTNTCGIRFSIGGNESPVPLGCTSTSRTSVVTANTNITFTRYDPEIRTWPGCLGLSLGGSNYNVSIKCFRALAYIDEGAGGWSSWSTWSTCSSTCSDGIRTRERVCNGTQTDNCPGNADQAKNCSDTACPVDGVWGDWSNWTPCSVTCDDGTQSRSRTCNNPPPSGGGQPCLDSNGQATATETVTQPCNDGTCPAVTDGGWSDWSNWTPCSVTCDDGTQSRSRTCNNPSPSGGGQPCLDSNGQSTATETVTQPCNDGTCPVVTDGGWSDWSNWTPCSVTCDDGTQSRSRSCNNPPPSGGGQPCLDGNGQATDTETVTQPCTDGACPAVTNGGWSDWSNWTPCSVTCDDGTQSRSRSCNNPPPSGGGQPCLDSNGQATATETVTQPCNDGVCPAVTNGGWGDWSNWTPCSVTCDDGTQSRSRSCNNPPPSGGGQPCLDGNGQATATETVTQPCNDATCPGSGPNAGQLKTEETAGAGIGVIIGGILGGIAVIVLVILLILCLVRRRRKEDKKDPPTVSYMPQGDDVTVTENELYDSENPSFAVNALFVGGIPETPTSPGYIPHFTTETGEGYAQIVDSTKSRDKPKERPKLGTFTKPTIPPKSEDNLDDAGLEANKGMETLESPDDKRLSIENDPDFGIENPGYDPTLFAALNGGQKVQKSEDSPSPYDYIDHDKLNRDDAEFERTESGYLTHQDSVNDSEQTDDGHYKRFINSDDSTSPATDDDGYLRSPTRNDKFVYPE